ncbi:MAG: HEAT repeat domain-containing protein [Polyangiales bacterium]
MSTFNAPVPASREEALRALGTTDAEVRRLVVRALEQAEIETARSVLSVVLADEDWRVRKEGIQLVHALAERADVVPLLVDALRAPSDAVALRNAAVEALSGLGASAAPAVEEALASGTLDADGSKLAVDVLGGARQPRSVPALISALDDVDANVRAAAAEALGVIGGEDAVPALQSVLAREDRFLRLVALEGLNRNAAVVAFSTLAPFLGDRILRHAAVAALARCTENEATLALVDALGDASRHVSETALRALGDRLRDDGGEAREHALKLGVSARARVLAAADSGDLALRRAAVPVLALLAHPSASDVTDALVRALRDPDLADDAESALASLGEPVLATLLDVARRGDGPSRAAVLSVLPLIARDNVPAIEALRDALRDPDREVVAAAAAAFATALSAGLLPNAADVHALLRIAAGQGAARGSIAAKAAAIALQSLRTLARVRPDAVKPHLAHVDAHGDEAPVVCALLSVAGEAEHVPWLQRAVSAESARTRKAAVEALGSIGGTAAAQALGYALTDEVSEVALAAIKALGRARDEKGQGVGFEPLHRLVDGATDPERSVDESLVSAAVRALGATGDPRAEAPLRPLVRSSSVAIACAALEALADLRAEGLRALAFESVHHPSSIVARTALDVLDATLEETDVALAAELAPALAHASWEVRRRAIEVVARLDPLSIRPLLRARASAETETVVKETLDRALADLDRRLARPSRPPPSIPPSREGDP